MLLITCSGFALGSVACGRQLSFALTLEIGNFFAIDKKNNLIAKLEKCMK